MKFFRVLLAICIVLIICVTIESAYKGKELVEALKAGKVIKHDRIQPSKHIGFVKEHFHPDKSKKVS
jgi:hypothetical protein